MSNKKLRPYGPLGGRTGPVFLKF